MANNNGTNGGGAVGDLQALKGYVLGTLAFGTALTTFLTQAFHTPLEPTLICTALVGAFFLTIVYLISRAEKRVELKLVEHQHESDKVISAFHQDLDLLKKIGIENQRSSLRTEMDNEIHRNPENHDTIIKYAYRYFKELNGDWVETEKVLEWVESEEKAGRKVHLPPELWKDIKAKDERDIECLH